MERVLLLRSGGHDLLTQAEGGPATEEVQRRLPVSEGTAAPRWVAGEGGTEP